MCVCVFVGGGEGGSAKLKVDVRCFAHCGIPLKQFGGRRVVFGGRGWGACSWLLLTLTPADLSIHTLLIYAPHRKKRSHACPSPSLHPTVM